jgi:hypothetical protein
MTPVNLLVDAVDNLWYWTYSIVVGWGASFTIILAVLLVVTLKVVRLNRKVNQLEARLVHAERDYNLSINTGKK